MDLVGIRFFWRDSTGVEQRYEPCIQQVEGTKSELPCWIRTYFRYPYYSCAYPPADCPCCLGIPGNIDGDPADLTDVSDHAALVDFLFYGGNISWCHQKNDVDGSGEIDISDLELLIDYLFFGGTLPQCSSPMVRGRSSCPPTEMTQGVK